MLELDARSSNPDDIVVKAWQGLTVALPGYATACGARLGQWMVAETGQLDSELATKTAELILRTDSGCSSRNARPYLWVVEISLQPWVEGGLNSSRTMEDAAWGLRVSHDASDGSERPLMDSSGQRAKRQIPRFIGNGYSATATGAAYNSVECASDGVCMPSAPSGPAFLLVNNSGILRTKLAPDKQ